MPYRNSRIPAPGQSSTKHSVTESTKAGTKTAIPTEPTNSFVASRQSKAVYGAKNPPPSKPEADQEAKSNAQNVVEIKQPGRPQIQRPSQFVAAHVGIPCTVRALDHHLHCGHKISTDQPEPCASNCKPLYPSARRDDEPFVCMTCVVSEIKRRHDAKVESFQREMRAIASATKKEFEREEAARRLEVIEIGWQELDLKEMRDRVGYGRWSRPFYVEPEYENAAQTIAEEHFSSEFEETRSTLSAASGDQRNHGRDTPSTAASTSSSRTSSTSWTSHDSSSAFGSKLPVRPALRRS